MTEIKFVNAEVLTVGPDEMLVIHLPEDTLPADTQEQLDYFDLWDKELKNRGLEDRVWVLVGDMEFSKLARHLKETIA